MKTGACRTVPQCERRGAAGPGAPSRSEQVTRLMTVVHVGVFGTRVRARQSRAVQEGRYPRGEGTAVAASWIAIEAITLTQWLACTTASGDSCAGSGSVDLRRRAERSSLGGSRRHES